MFDIGPSKYKIKTSRCSDVKLKLFLKRSKFQSNDFVSLNAELQGEFINKLTSLIFGIANEAKNYLYGG